MRMGFLDSLDGWKFLQNLTLASRAITTEQCFERIHVAFVNSSTAE